MTPTGDSIWPPRPGAPFDEGWRYDPQQSGHYEIVCPDARGCDSLVVIDIQILAPKWSLTPDTLGCDSSKVVILDGHCPP